MDSAPTSTSYQFDIENHALSFLREYALLVYFVLLVSHSVIALIIFQEHPSYWVAIWIFSFFILQTISLKYRRSVPLKKIPHDKKLLRGTIVNIVDGYIVASCVIFFPVIDDITRMLVITLLLITCTGAILTTVGYTRFFLAFTIPILSAVILSSAISSIFYDGSTKLLIISLVTFLIIYPLFKVSSAISFHFKEALVTNLRIKQINQDLKLAVRDAKRANESKTRFLACASHDLRQPINTLSLFIASLTLKDTKQEHAEIITHMNTAISSIDAQLESLLDISKLDAGIVTVKKQQFKLTELVEELCSTYGNQLPNQVRMRVNTNAPDMALHTDIVLFERILANIISNSIKHTKTGFIDITVNDIDDVAQIIIKDTGEGIRENELEKIFDEFYQIENSERNAQKGLGLGLSIVKRLSSLLNINLELTSQYGVGTEVKIELANVDYHQKGTTKENSQSVLKQKLYKNVIILDNELSNLAAMDSVLSTMGYQSKAYSDAKEALVAFNENHFDLALIDYRLPGPLNGNDVINEMIKTNFNTRFFLLTGDSEVQESEENYKIIHKPITDKKLENIFEY